MIARSLKVFESTGSIWSVEQIENALQIFFSGKKEGEEDPPPVPLSALIRSLHQQPFTNHIRSFWISECFNPMSLFTEVDHEKWQWITYACAGGIQVRLGLCHAQASALKGLVPTSNYSFGVLSIFAWMQTLVGRTCIITRLRRWSAKQRKHQKFGRRITWWAIFGVAYMLLWLTFHFTVMQLQMLWDAGPWMVQTLEGGLWPWAQKTKV